MCDPSALTQAEERIDEALKDASGRSLVSADEVTDTLLDIRSLIKEASCLTPTPA